MKAIFIDDFSNFIVERSVMAVQVGMKMRFNMQVWVVTDVFIDIPVDYWEDPTYSVTVRKFAAFEDF